VARARRNDAGDGGDVFVDRVLDEEFDRVVRRRRRNGRGGGIQNVEGGTGAQAKSDKLDLLLAIDNSFSMADKQAYLAEAVPDLVAGLVTPACVDASGAPNGSVADITKPPGSQCASGAPAVKPITDIHIAIVDSSLGAFGDKSVCADTPPQNDQGRLVNRTTTGGPVPEAPVGFLAWFPSVPNNDGKTAPQGSTPAITDEAKLIMDFQSLVAGVGEQGCGLEAQLESWYHFLVQPDPWASITIDSNNIAHYTGIDDTILQERHDFLRPDSLVAVVMLTDEDDSFSDPLAIGGQGWAFSVSNFPESTQARSGGAGTTAPRGTTACNTNPGDPACTSCGFAKNCNTADPSCQAIQNDVNCKTNNGYYAGDDDSLNIRFFHMKQRYGVDPQYPISRYVQGLSSGLVPKGAEEHNNAGAYQAGTGSCTNPLFAATLPRSSGEDTCTLAVGPRSPSLIFFAIIGGVPNQLLHYDPSNADGSKLTADDWVKILGKDPLSYDYTGIDPHMIQSSTPRAGLAPPSTASGDDGTDPIHGREWDTLKNDLQFACTFPLVTPKVCPKAGDPTCADCDGTHNPPLCSSDPLTQTRGKAYPTIRQLEVAHGLGDRGIVASLCPRTVNLAGQMLEPNSNASGPNPLYGYRPAVKTMIDRFAGAISAQ
jgi:hypothetical protein